MLELMANTFHPMISIVILSLCHFHLLLLDCDSNDQNIFPEDKAIQDILKPSIVEKIWRPNSCLTYSSRIGTCLTGPQCLSRNGTIGGLCLAMFTFCCVIRSVNEVQNEDRNQIITFPNLPLNSECVAYSKKRGICLNSEECVRRIGIPDGLCSPNTTCCLIESICGKTVRQNGTEIVNKLYPLTTSDANVCQVMVERVPDVCQIRIGLKSLSQIRFNTIIAELLEFHLSQPDPDGHCTTDALMIQSPTGEQVPIICGENSGQHFYLEIGRNLKKFGNPIRISIVTNGQNFRRKWKIRVIMINCQSLEMAPNGCLQYLTSVSGIVRSFNFGVEIANRARYMSDIRYTVCIRPEEDYCWIEWWPEFEGSFSWGQQTFNQSLLAHRMTDLCNDDDFITIDDTLRSDKTPELERICGTSFSKNNYLFSQSKPFHLKVFSNSNHKPNRHNSQIGFSLNFKQIQCNLSDE